MKTLVTSALPYANGSIHIGHLVEYIQTDIFVRFLKLTGEDAIYCCADDTHGTPIEFNAFKQGIKPEELIAKYHDEHTKDFRDFLIEFDSYYSTNSEENRQFSEQIYNELKSKGHIYQKAVKQVYCENCKRFLPDRYVKGRCPKCGALDQYGDICEKCSTALKANELVDPKCSVCGNKPTEKESMHYFFKLSEYSGRLSDWLTSNKNLQPEIVAYIMNWIKDGLQDWDITRDGPYFGFKIPGEDNKYFYVWLDAPIGYISSTANYCRNGKCGVDDYWKSKDGRIIHFIGKDIIYFHFLFWPAVLMGSGFSLPDTIMVHGFLTVNGEKMSKSRGTFITAREFLQKYDPEQLRFYYAHLLSRKLVDVNLDFKDFEVRVNNDMVGNLGNFVYRVISFANKNLDSEIKYADQLPQLKELYKEIREAYQDYNFTKAAQKILEVSAIGNKHFQENQPWKVIKEDPEKARKIVGDCINIAKDLSILTAPILPRFSAELQSQLGLKGLKWADLDSKIENHRIGGAKILVKKIEEKK